MTTPVVDDLMARLIDEMHADGEDGGMGRKAMAAIRWLLPQFQREGSVPLPRGDAAAVGFRRDAPATSRLPPPELVVAAVVMAVAWLLDRLERWAIWLYSLVGARRRTPDGVLDVNAVGMAYIDIVVSDEHARRVLGYRPILDRR